MRYLSKILGVVVMVLIGASSCGRKAETPTASVDIVPEALPFCLTDSSGWGMMDTDGNVIINPKFDFEPTVATCGRFWVPDSSDRYMLYSLESDPQMITHSRFCQISLFVNGRAFVARDDSSLCVVDTLGRCVTELSNINGFRPDIIAQISEGYATFAVDTLQGVVSDRGDILLPPVYTAVGPVKSGRVIACTGTDFMTFDYVYEKGVAVDTSFATGTAAKVFDTGGNTLFEISPTDYPMIATHFYGNYLPVASLTDDGPVWGLLDSEGNVTLKPQIGIRSITDVRGEFAIFTDDSYLYGLMDIRGHIILQPTYANLEFAGDNALIALATNSGDSEKGFTLLDFEGTTLGGQFVTINPFMPPGFRYAPALNAAGMWQLIGHNGLPSDKIPVMNGLNTDYSNNYSLFAPVRARD